MTHHYLFRQILIIMPWKMIYLPKIDARDL